MKKIVVVCGKNCGYCKKAKMLIKRAVEKEPQFNTVKLRYIDERSVFSKKYHHSLIPAFFYGKELFFEGNPSMEVVSEAFKKVL